MQIPMFGFACLAFLLLAVVLAVAVFFAFKSGQQGQTKLSGPAGCMVALALLVIAGVGFLCLGFVALVTLPNEAVRRGPVKSFEFHWDDREIPAPAPGESATEEAQLPLRLTIELRGLHDPSSVMKWLRQRTDSDTHISVREAQDGEGRSTTVIELALPADHHDAREMRELREELERDVPELRLPASVKIEFRGPDE